MAPSDRSPTSIGATSAKWVIHLSLGVVATLLLLAVGQPIFSNELWWHLAMGESYAAGGPWLGHDALLHTAEGPPAPAAWLAAVALYAVEQVAGFQGLRLLHVVTVVAILALAWSLLRRASESRSLASLGTLLFIALSAYRLNQLQPSLFTILAALLLYRLVLESRAAPSRARGALALALMLLWANLHPGFLLGPIWLAVGVAGLVVSSLVSRQGAWPRERISTLSALLLLGLLVSLVNPSGAAQHLAVFTAGVDTPTLSRVADGWMGFRPWQLGQAKLPPSPLTWGIGVVLLIATPLVAWVELRRPTVPEGEKHRDRVDPVLIAIALAGLAAILIAMRFSWLGVFPLLLVASAWRLHAKNPHGAGVLRGAAIASALILPAFLWLGDWPMISRSIPRSGAGYAMPYHASQYQAHGVWLLADAKLAGNLFNDSDMGSFLGYWLSPRLRTFINGSRNVPPDVIEANRAIRGHRGAKAGETLAGTLDRYGIDIFFGIHPPAIPPAGRAWFYTTAHLAQTPGWLMIFRNASSGIYLRQNARNAENLERVVQFYADQGVPFDRERGFDVERVIRDAPRWAVQHGVAPIGFSQIIDAGLGLESPIRRNARERLAMIYATLGLHERAIRTDRGLLRKDPDNISARRRLVWSLLQRGRGEEAAEQAARLSGVDGLDRLSQGIVSASKAYVASASPEEAARIAVLLPLFTRNEASLLMAGIASPEARASLSRSGRRNDQP